MTQGYLGKDTSHTVLGQTIHRLGFWGIGGLTMTGKWNPVSQSHDLLLLGGKLPGQKMSDGHADTINDIMMRPGRIRFGVVHTNVLGDPRKLWLPGHPPEETAWFGTDDLLNLLNRRATRRTR